MPALDTISSGGVELRITASLRGVGFRFGEHPNWVQSKDGTRAWLKNAPQLEVGVPYSVPEFIRLPEDPQQASPAVPQD